MSTLSPGAATYNKLIVGPLILRTRNKGRVPVTWIRPAIFIPSTNSLLCLVLYIQYGNARLKNAVTAFVELIR